MEFFNQSSTVLKFEQMIALFKKKKTCVFSYFDASKLTVLKDLPLDTEIIRMKLIQLPQGQF